MKEEIVTPREWLGMCGYTEEEIERYYFMKDLEEQILYPHERVILNVDEHEWDTQTIRRILRRREEEKMMKLTNLKWTKSPK